ncbi:hypothetical protein, partial [Klebsiella pneumoniae]|uniref:hypothetical protein n=1 Tax=Klebsiella pneumoniae TaxID=573 RepID=UPI001C8F9F38
SLNYILSAEMSALNFLKGVKEIPSRTQLRNLADVAAAMNEEDNKWNGLKDLADVASEVKEEDVPY